MVCGNQGRFVNRVRVRKDRHPHNARPGTAPINLVWSCRNLNTNGFNLIDEKFMKICTSRFLWDATANAKIYRRYFISKIFFDLSKNNIPRDLKFLSQDSYGMLPQALWDPSQTSKKFSSYLFYHFFFFRFLTCILI